MLNAADLSLSTSSLSLMRVMYAVAILGAGAVGLTTLFAPRLASQYIFAGGTEVDVYLRILGALWLALGLASTLGLSQPLKFSVILLIQLFYKTAWLAAAALPALASGNREVGLIFLTILFIVWVIALLFALPFRYLFGTL